MFLKDQVWSKHSKQSEWNVIPLTQTVGKGVGISLLQWLNRFSITQSYARMYTPCHGHPFYTDSLMLLKTLPHSSCFYTLSKMCLKGQPWSSHSKHSGWPAIPPTQMDWKGVGTSPFRRSISFSITHSYARMYTPYDGASLLHRFPHFTQNTETLLIKTKATKVLHALMHTNYFERLFECPSCPMKIWPSESLHTKSGPTRTIFQN